MKEIAIYPGSFNPIHEGHQQVIDLALQIFDEVIIVIAQNPEKEPIENLKERVDNIRKIYAHKLDSGKISVIGSRKMTGRIAKEYNAYIIKGVRNFIDFQNELEQASFNRTKFGVETILIPSTPELSFMSSTLMRELKKYNEN
jgi:pantetheine-phosphate adenylyltransferase